MRMTTLTMMMIIVLCYLSILFFFGYCTLLSLLWPWLSLLSSVCKTTECQGDFMFSAFLLSIKIMLIIIMIIIIIVCCFFLYLYLLVLKPFYLVWCYPAQVMWPCLNNSYHQEVTDLGRGRRLCQGIRCNHGDWQICSPLSWFTVTSGIVVLLWALGNL